MPQFGVCTDHVRGMAYIQLLKCRGVYDCVGSDAGTWDLAPITENQTESEIEWKLLDTGIVNG